MSRKVLLDKLLTYVHSHAHFLVLSDYPAQQAAVTYRDQTSRDHDVVFLEKVLSWRKWRTYVPTYMLPFLFSLPSATCSCYKSWLNKPGLWCRTASAMRRACNLRSSKSSTSPSQLCGEFVTLSHVTLIQLGVWKYSQIWICWSITLSRAPWLYIHVSLIGPTLGRSYKASNEINFRGWKSSQPSHGRQIWNQQSHVLKFVHITQLWYKRMCCTFTELPRSKQMFKFGNTAQSGSTFQSHSRDAVIRYLYMWWDLSHVSFVSPIVRESH